MSVESSKIYQVDAFVAPEGGGNPAGVTVCGKMPDDWMQAQAEKVGFSETAFVSPVPQKKNSWDVRFFTPTKEIELCGHATIASFAFLLDVGLIQPGWQRMNCQAGELEVKVSEDGLVMMDQAPPMFREAVSVEDLATILDVPVEWIADVDFQPSIVSTGVWDIMVGVRGAVELAAINPRVQLLADYSRLLGVEGVHIFTTETRNEAAVAMSRNFAPAAGIDEEAATGTSTGALAAALVQQGLVAPGKEPMLFEQGDFMGKPSHLYAELVMAGDLVAAVRIAGRARVQDVISW